MDAIADGAHRLWRAINARAQAAQRMRQAPDETEVVPCMPMPTVRFNGSKLASLLNGLAPHGAEAGSLPPAAQRMRRCSSGEAALLAATGPVSPKRVPGVWAPAVTPFGAGLQHLLHRSRRHEPPAWPGVPKTQRQVAEQQQQQQQPDQGPPCTGDTGGGGGSDATCWVEITGPELDRIMRGTAALHLEAHKAHAAVAAKKQRAAEAEARRRERGTSADVAAALQELRCAHEAAGGACGRDGGGGGYVGVSAADKARLLAAAKERQLAAVAAVQDPPKEFVEDYYDRIGEEMHAANEQLAVRCLSRKGSAAGGGCDLRGAGGEEGLWAGFGEEGGEEGLGGNEQEEEEEEGLPEWA